MARSPEGHTAATAGTSKVPSLAAHVAARRLELGLSKRAAATMAGVGYSTWDAVEKGLQTNPRPLTVRKMAQALDEDHEILLSLPRRSRSTTMVTAGTGSGKTSATVTAVLDALAADRALNERTRRILVEIYDTFVDLLSAAR
jgi:transcriptional regulator with XRE-family HTH domain